MKKRRFLSILTSVAMAATVVTSTLASTVSAATVLEEDSTMVLRFAPEKSAFSMDEVAAGNAKTTVALMCDKYDAAEEVTQILTSIKGSDDGITFQNMAITELNAFKVDGGWGEATFDFEVTGVDPADSSQIASQTGFFIQNGADPFVVSDLNNSIVTFDVIFDSSMEAGTYTVDFMDNFSINSGTVAGDGTIITTYGASVNANSAPATFVLGDGVVETTEPSTEPSSDTTAPREYVGTCDIWADKDVKGAVGDQVEVNFYANTNGVDIRGFEARPIFDTSALKIVNYQMGKGFAAKPTANEELGTYVIASAAKKIVNNPEVPYLTLTFEILEGASGTYPIDIQGCNGAAEPVINATNGGEGITYLEASVTEGSIVVGDTTTAEATTAERVYIGTCDVWADKDVKGAVGDQVTVNFYADTHDVDIRGFEARPIFDTSALKIVGYQMGKGFAAKPTANEELGTYVIASAAKKIVNNPEVPYLTLTFEILEGASGTYPIDIQGCNGAAEPVINATNGGEGITYLTPNVTEGSIVVEEATEEVTTTAPVTTTEPSTTVSVVTTVSEVTSVSVVTSVSEVTVTSVSEVTSVSVVTTVSEVTSVSVVTTVSEVTSVSVVTSVSEVTVTSVSEVTSVSVVTSVSEVTVTSISEVTSVSVVTTVSQVTVTSISEVTVTSISEVTSISVVTSVSIVTVTEPVTTTEEPVESDIVVSIVGPGVEEDSTFWYHSDNVEFFKDGISVVVGDEDVTAKAVITFASTPAEVYDGENFDYEVAFTVIYNGQEIEGKLPVKIAPRGDTNLSAGAAANIYDAIVIAKYILPKPAATIDEGFQTFVADNNEDEKVNIYDAINIAKLILPANAGDWDKVNADHQQWIKD